MSKKSRSAALAGSCRHERASGEGTAIDAMIARLAAAAAPAATAALPAPVNISRAFLASLDQAPSNGCWERSCPDAGSAASAASGPELSAAEAVSIDIVAMLFDFIFNDPTLPPPVLSLLAQLQMPVLKVAMRDHSFFACRRHPARRFLDGIAAAAREASLPDAGEFFVARLGAAVDRINCRFETHVEVFAEVLLELQSLGRRPSLGKKRLIATLTRTIGRREAQELAARRAAAELGPLLAAPQPPLVRRFLDEQWRRVVEARACVALSGQPKRAAAADDAVPAGEAALREAVDLAAQLVWSVAPKKSAHESMRLIGLLPGLLASLGAGLAEIRIGKAASAAFFDQLAGLHACALRGNADECVTVAPAAPATPATQPPGLRQSSFFDNGVTIESIELAGAAAPADAALAAQVRGLRRGDCVQFRSPAGDFVGQRLDWISPLQGLLVFSDHKAARALAISPAALAFLIEDGRARIVAQSALIEQAIDRFIGAAAIAQSAAS